MSRPTGPERRSGDPRKRAAASTESRPDRRRVAVVVAAVVVGVAVLVLAVVAMRPEPDRAAQDSEARRHVEAACDLTGKAGEAAEAVQVDERSRYAASVLLLDRAIIESARAAESEPTLVDLDTALQDVHTAGHEGDPEGWQTALDEALAECRTVLG